MVSNPGMAPRVGARVGASAPHAAGAAQAGIVPQGEWTGVASPGTDVVITTGGVPQGQVMYAFIADRGSNADTVTKPAGWTTVIEQVRGSVGKLGVYRKVAGASEPSSYTFTCSSSNTQFGAIVALSGVDTTTPEDVAAAGATGSATGTHTCPSVTTVTADAQILRVACTAVSAPPISWTWAIQELVDGNAASTGAGGLSVAIEPQASAGATGTEAATFAQSSSTTYAAVTVAVRPA